MTKARQIRPILVLATMAIQSLSAWAQPVPAEEPALFLGIGQRGTLGPEAYVISLSDSAQILEVRQYLAERAAGKEKRPLVPTCLVRAGLDGVNRNYAAPGTPAWGWQVTSVVRLERLTRPPVEPTVIIPSRDSAPSEIADLLAGDSAPAATGSVPSTLKLPGNTIALYDYPILMELRPDNKAGFANVSNRGFAGSGNQTLITGFVVDGGTPRNLLVRVLGPSLAVYGVTEVLANPRFAVYRGGEKIADNDDWTQGNLNRPHLSTMPPPVPFNLIPADPREPALQLSLPPGVYTIVVSGAEGNVGVALTEVYSL
jgi:hypothetical protein